MTLVPQMLEKVQYVRKHRLNSLSGEGLPVDIIPEVIKRDYRDEAVSTVGLCRNLLLSSIGELIVTIKLKRVTL